MNLNFLGILIVLFVCALLASNIVILNSRSSIVSDYDFWKDIGERFKFFLMLAALCACGYLAWNTFFYIVLALLFGGVAFAMIPLYNYSQGKLSSLRYLAEPELEDSISTAIRAKQILEKFYQEYPEIASLESSGSLFGSFNEELRTARAVYERVQQQRQDKESYYSDERRRNGLHYGAPLENGRCPTGYPITATRLPPGNTCKGIYHCEGDRGYGAERTYWCFKCVEHAERDGFRPPRHKDEHHQKRYPNKAPCEQGQEFQ